MIRLVVVVALVVAAGAVLLLRADDSEGVIQGFGLSSRCSQSLQSSPRSSSVGDVGPGDNAFGWRELVAICVDRDTISTGST
jgi:hypothetical protein